MITVDCPNIYIFIYIRLFHYKASSINFQFRAFKGPHEYLPAMHEVYSISDNVNFTSGDRFVTVWGKIFGNWMTDEVHTKGNLLKRLYYIII